MRDHSADRADEPALFLGLRRSAQDVPYYPRPESVRRDQSRFTTCTCKFVIISLIKRRTIFKGKPTVGRIPLCKRLLQLLEQPLVGGIIAEPLLGTRQLC